MATMTWNQFKAFVDEALRANGLEDATIDWIDVHMPDTQDTFSGRCEARITGQGRLIVD